MGNEWEHFLNKNIVVILEDPPLLYPSKKEGILTGISDTHIFIINHKNNVKEAYNINLIRRLSEKETY